MRAAGIEPTDHGTLSNFPPCNPHGAGKMSDEDYLSQLRDFLEVSTVDEALRVHMAILNREYDGAAELVSEIQSTGIKAGCLSNTNHLHISHCVEAFDVCRLFNPFVVSYEVGCNKPSPEIFEAFELQSGCDPHEILFFDDGPANVKAAEDRGWIAYPIDPNQETIPQIRKVLVAHRILN